MSTPRSAGFESHRLCGMMRCLCKQPDADMEEVNLSTSEPACTAVVTGLPCNLTKSSTNTTGAAQQTTPSDGLHEAAVQTPSVATVECLSQKVLQQSEGEPAATPAQETTFQELPKVSSATAITAARTEEPAMETQQTEQITTTSRIESINVSIANPATVDAAAGITGSLSSKHPANSRVIVEAAHALCTEDARSTIRALLTELFKPAQQRRRSDTGQAAEYRTTAGQYKTCLAQLPVHVQCRLLELGEEDKAAVFKLAVPLWLAGSSDSHSLWDCLCVALQQHRQLRAQLGGEGRQQDKRPKGLGRVQPVQDKATDSRSEATVTSKQDQADMAAVAEVIGVTGMSVTVAAVGPSLRPSSPRFCSLLSINKEQMSEDAAFVELARFTTQPVRTSFSLICRNADRNTACLQGLRECCCAVAIFNLPKSQDQVLIKQLIKAQPKTMVSDEGLQLLKELAAHYVQHMADPAYVDPAVPVYLPGWVK